MKKKILSIIGTRPEAIKMAPLIIELEKNININHSLCLTSQHKETVSEIINFFNLKIDYDLNIMKKNQTLFDITIEILKKLEKVIISDKPDIILVHGDTTTSFVSALCAFYQKVKICHIEAGLRTHKKFEPFPEEINRKMVDVLVDYYYAPTELAEKNLINEGVNKKNILITGNTVVDAVNLAITKIDENSISFIDQYSANKNKRIILVTAHRRENFGQSLTNICDAIEEISMLDNIHIFSPVHPNPNVKDFFYSRFSKNNNISLLTPLNYPEFLFLMNKSELIISDSGGVQEEAPSLNKKVIVLRNITERPEGVQSGHIHVVGLEKDAIVDKFHFLMQNKEINTQNPYGDGNACQRIVKHLESL